MVRCQHPRVPNGIVGNVRTRQARSRQSISSRETRCPPHPADSPTRYQSNGLDLFAFGSYGALHFASPIIAGWWIWGFGTQGAACTFGWTLGAQNLAGLATHIVFPNASPWL